MRTFVADRLRVLRRTPQMWSYTREAFAAQVSVLLQLIEVDDRPLHRKIFGIPGTSAADPDKLMARVDDAWAGVYVDEAAALAKLELVEPLH